MNRGKKGEWKWPIDRVAIMEAMIRCLAKGVMIGGFIVAFAHPIVFRFEYPDASETRLFLMAWPHLLFGLLAMAFGYWAFTVFDDNEERS